MSTMVLLSLLVRVSGGALQTDTAQQVPEAWLRLAEPVRQLERKRFTPGQLVASIAAQVRFPVVLDPSVPPSVRTRRLTFEVGHLNGYEALACLGRILGLDVVVLQECAVLASPERMPGGWRAMAAAQHREWYERRLGSADTWARRLARRSGLRLGDVTLGAALRRVREAYAIDVFASEAVWEAQRLVTLAVGAATLRDVLGRLARQVGAVVRCRDGAAWLEGGRVTTEARRGRDSERVSIVVPAEAARRVPQPAVSRLTRVVHVPAARRTPAETLAAIAEQACVAIRGASPAGPEGRDPEISAAAGPLGDVLEAARLIWRERWRVEERPASDDWTVMLSPPTGE